MADQHEQFFAKTDVPGISPTRDLIGYADDLPLIRWPRGATVAVQIVVNYEEGSEKTFAMGDAANDSLHDVANGTPDHRDLSVESAYEYGSRAGIWRLLRIFDELQVQVTVFAAAVALERNPRLSAILAGSQHEIAAHGYRWSNHFEMDREIEADLIGRALDSIESSTGRRPVGWYSRKPSLNTRALLVEIGGIQYDSNAFNDDLPYWTTVEGKAHLVVPYSMICNDVRFVVAPGYASPHDFYTYLKSTLDRLRRDGDDRARMMSVGLHPRISGHPARAGAVADFIQYACGCDDVWVARRTDIASSFVSQFPAPLGLARNYPISG